MKISMGTKGEEEEVVEEEEGFIRICVIP